MEAKFNVKSKVSARTVCVKTYKSKLVQICHEIFSISQWVAKLAIVFNFLTIRVI